MTQVIFTIMCGLWLSTGMFCSWTFPFCKD